MELKDIKSLTLYELENEISELGERGYRAKQIYRWLNLGIKTFDEMTDISKSFREKLKQNYMIANADIERKLVSNIDGTIKYLFKLYDGEYVEAVLMKYNHGYSICISTQVGCKMGCKFCATGKSGFSRNLLPSEMLAQIQTAQIDNDIRISNIVLMGMGEPLDNYDNVMKFLLLVSSPDGMNIGMRHISLSTCGIVDKIYALADEKMQLTLSISLHATNDKKRNEIMPINQKWNMESLIKACRYYSNKTRRRISFEYTMINGVNDSEEDAKELSRVLKGIISHVNLIPMNNIENGQYNRSSKKRIENFTKVLEKNGVNATVRRTLGADINASCGQLKRRAQQGR